MWQKYERKQTKGDETVNRPDQVIAEQEKIHRFIRRKRIKRSKQLQKLLGFRVLTVKYMYSEEYDNCFDELRSIKRITTEVM